jgi:uncharacterized repeat protein (TIGR03803 family)
MFGEFSTNSDGAHPDAALALADNILYGAAYEGGIAGDGALFSISTNGTGFTNLHNFTGVDGVYTRAGLIVSGATLYGAAQHGGTLDAGTVFELSTNGTSFATLHNFDGGDGLYPEAGLALSGNTLYGTTAGGGALGYGAVFAVNTDGSGFATIHSFDGVDAYGPLAVLLLSNNVLYGTAPEGGDSGNGTVFSLNTGGSNLATLYSFTAALGNPVTNNEGANPLGSLILSSNTMYGTAISAGASGYGTVFSLTTNSTAFNALYNFTNGSDGAYPQSGLVLLTNTLYGTAVFGGSSSNGTVFSVNTDGTVFSVLHTFAGPPNDGLRPYGGLVAAGATLYGNLEAGGTMGYGLLYSVNADGAGYTVVHNFNGTNGAYPQSALIVSGDTLFGSTYSGGGSIFGTLFKVNTNGSDFTVLHRFTGGVDGEFPVATLAISGFTLYGTALNGGATSNGTVFKVNTDGTAFAVLHNFTFSDGSVPHGGLVVLGDTLYGTTRSGGVPGNGTIYDINTDGTGFSTLYSFSTTAYTSDNADGAQPAATLLPSGNVLYGAASAGGTSNSGTVFSFSVVLSNAPRGSLQVAILPAGAVSAGAQWQLDGGESLNSGVTVTNILEGDHTISFSPVSGWITPPDEVVTIEKGVTVPTSGIYLEPGSTGAELILLTNGYGAIQHAAWPRKLLFGAKYTAVAVAKPGNIFAGWIGGANEPFTLLSALPAYSFTNQPGLVLEANFVTNVFEPVRGTFRGLFAPVFAARTQTNSGSFIFSMTKGGAVTGKIAIGNQAAVLAGKFNVDGTATFVTKAGKEIPSLTAALQLDFSDRSISGTVSDTNFTAQADGDLDVFTGTNKATEIEGRYTFIIPGATNSNAGPYGASYGTVTVGPRGTIALAGRLADGTVISQSSVVSKDGDWPMYVSLYDGQGSLWCWNNFGNHTLTNDSALSWINVTNSAKTAVNRTGFTNQEATLVGGLYVSTMALPENLTATLEGGDLPLGITNGVTLSAADRISLTNSMDETNKLALTIYKSTGAITGRFANPVDPEHNIRVYGVILQSQTNAQGYFLGTNQGGSFLLDASGQ